MCVHILSTENNTPLTIWGTGAPLRQFIYSYDLARLFIWAMREYEEVSPITVTVDLEDEITIKTAAETIIEATGFTGEVIVSLLATNRDWLIKQNDWS